VVEPGQLFSALRLGAGARFALLTQGSRVGSSTDGARGKNLESLIKCACSSWLKAYGAPTP